MQDAQEANQRKLFVGNLSFNTTKDTLVDVFSEYGKVEDAILITDKMTGRSRGIAFVTFSTVEEAQAAISALHGKDLDGREIVVQVSRPQRKPEGGFNKRNNFSGRRYNNSDRN